MPELGKKYECAECGAKFYDLGKPEPACPRCGTSARDTSPTEKRAAPEPRARYVAPPPPAEVEEDLVADDIVEDDEEILTVPGAEDEEEEDDDDEEV